MATDDERREVAARLRSKKPEEFAAPFGRHVFAHIISSVFPNQMLLSNRILRLPYQLADLVDRPTTTRHGKFKTKYGSKTPCCEVCGYSIGDMRWDYCPKCGAVITDG